jgi:hypothetical protein
LKSEEAISAAAGGGASLGGRRQIVSRRKEEIAPLLDPLDPMSRSLRSWRARRPSFSLMRHLPMRPVFAYCRLFFSADIDIRNEESIIKQLRKRWNIVLVSIRYFRSLYTDIPHVNIVRN